ncbi:hypothetical protein AX15_001228 [Amanita polypyramis BW_CC]|nr:hypothetical protein AX15_001228 [Amanita polypyramis BW_CC]
MDLIRASRLEKLFKKTIKDKVVVPPGQKDLFLEAICAQSDPVACISEVVGSDNGMASLCAAVRYDSSPAFVNNQATKVLQYLRKPEVEHVSNGQYLEKILINLMTPPIFWEALSSAYNSRQLSGDGEICFAWLVYKLVSFQADETKVYRNIVTEKDYIHKFLQSISPETRNYADLIKRIIDTGKVASASDTGSLAGGRHDNDFLDFREIAVMPTVDEMLSNKKPFLRTSYMFEDPNTKEDRISIYLDNQFRLLREDMLSEIREELQVASGQTKRRYRVQIYQKLEVLDIYFGTDKKRTNWSIRFRLGEDLPIFKSSKVKPKDRVEFLKKKRRIFSHQSPVCLIVDDETVAFPLIDRDEGMLAENPPIIILQFDGESTVLKTLTKLKSARSIKLFAVDVAIFSYEPILKAIQRINQLPLSEELLFWEASKGMRTAQNIPQAIVSALRTDPCQELRSLLGTSKSIKLDISQGQSFLNGLTQSVSLIQGPPGTGKSFIGALLAKAIHDHTSQNILVVCYTNHALDQFLEDLMSNGIPSSSIVRLGGTGKATAGTVQLALRNQSVTHRFTTTDRHVIDSLKAEIETNRTLLEMMFKKYQSESTSLKDILDWMEFENPCLFNAFQVPTPDDGMVQVDRKGNPISDTYLLYQWSKGFGPGRFIDHMNKFPGLWEMKKSEREALVAEWVGGIMKEKLTNFYSVTKQYNEHIHQLERKFVEKDSHTLQSKRIIGCTTTAAAKFTELLQSVSPSVLLVEEAGEILESHILTALGREKNQLILIGDHKQLRPKVNSYGLTVEKGDSFDLNRSLFERLALQGYPHTTLSQQHRMRPGISALIRLLTYPDLVDAPQTKGRPNLLGVRDSIVLIDHDKPEGEMDDLADRLEGAKSSKQNMYEVQMVLKIVRYLIQQGYSTDKMVVLTPYLGQLQKLNSELKALKETDPVLGDLDAHELARAGLLTPDANARKQPLRLATIDNYQGEESDIVIVSLTRSNQDHDIGFMSSPERVNVMLSRARNALIMIGNVDTFTNAKKGKDVWSPLLNKLKKDSHVYNGFPIKCERHPKKIGLLKLPEDFDHETPDGGCREPCGVNLSCGLHQCHLRCHPGKDHSKVYCQEVAFDRCSNGHDASYLCHKGPPSFCNVCDKEKRQAEKQKKDQFERQKKQEQAKKDHELKMVELDRRIQLARQDIRDAQLAAEREQARLQKENDLRDARDLATRARQTQSTIISNVGSFLSNILSPAGSQNPDPNASVQKSPVAAAAASPASTSGNRQPNQPTQPTQPIPQGPTNKPQPPSPPNTSSSLPDGWKLKPSESEAEWSRQKDIEGARNDAIDSVMKMTGLESVKAQLLRIKSKIDTAQRQNASLKGERFNIVFLGNPGTGKTTVARHYAKFLASVGVLPGNSFVETTGSRLSNEGVDGAKKLVEGMIQGGGGTIFVDEAYQLTSEGNFGGGQVLDFLLAEMENNTDKLVFILAGYSKQMEKFFEHNPGLQSRVPYQLVFEDYDKQELLQMFIKRIESVWGGRMNVEGGVEGLYSRIAITRLARGRGTNGFGNARALQNMVSRIQERQAHRVEKERRQGGGPDDFLLTSEDIIGPPPNKVMDESKAWKKLQEMIGLESVKKTIREFFVLIETNYLRELQETPIIQVSLNRCFLGPPGTGKTTVAKLYGQILKDLNLLSNGEVVMKNPSDFIGAHLGQSERNTRGILDSTKGKVLVIDEAYMLYSGSKSGGGQDPYKTAVIDTIVAEVQSTASDDRCVLLLGYEEQMTEMFQNVNPGLSRRFDIERAFRFENFNDAELLQILELKMKQQGLSATDPAKKVAINLLSRARNRPNFGNGGEVDNVLDRAKARSQQRLGPSANTTLEREDFDPDHDRAERASTNLEKLFADIVGCEDVIQKLRDYQRIAKTMEARGMDARNKIPMNFIFKGPPGTGKTTTARKMGQVFYDMGFLSAVDVVECSASDLVGQYVGHTGPKTRKMFEKALGKVLFIDEAYRLAEGHFAQESMDEIVALLTDEKFMGKMMVILAGYDQDINRLMNVNTGLSSRFPETINFYNMPVDRCLQLLEKELAKDKVIFPALRDTTSATYTDLSQVIAALGQLASWGNGRDIKTLAGQMVQEAFKNADTIDAQAELTIADEDALECARTMLKERVDRERNVNHRHSSGLPMKPLSNTQDPPPPTTTSTSTEQAPPPPASSQQSSSQRKQSNRQRGSNKQREPQGNNSRTTTPDPRRKGRGVAQRDPGVSDNVWRQLQDSKRRQEEIERNARAAEAELKRKIEEEKRKEEELAARRRELEERERQARDEAERQRLQRVHEQERLKELAAKWERERIERELKEKKRQEEQRRQREAQIQQKLRSMGVCVRGFQWLPYPGGYRCAGGTHFVTNAHVSYSLLFLPRVDMQKDKPLHSLFAGATAGAVEAFITYPAEFAKTRSQFSGKKESPLAIIRTTLSTKGITGLYSGCSALIIGNATKAGVRFVSYDHFKQMLVDPQGKLSAPKSLLAGLGAGMMEAVFAVTPSETIKTKLIDDSKRPTPRYRGLIHGTTCIVREEGLTGIYRGLFPVMMRQGANSAVRFTTYVTLKQFVQGTARPGQQLPSTITFGIGAIAGLVTVYTTMPFDVIKTRMQSLEARTQYRNSFHCAYRVFTEEGILRFWTGTGPRLVRLVLSGGIVFTVYENVMKAIGGLERV